MNSINLFEDFEKRRMCKKLYKWTLRLKKLRFYSNNIFYYHGHEEHIFCTKLSENLINVQNFSPLKNNDNKNKTLRMTKVSLLNLFVWLFSGNFLKIVHEIIANNLLYIQFPINHAYYDSPGLLQSFVSSNFYHHISLMRNWRKNFEPLFKYKLDLRAA